jgi:S1-C subfamily serine protease
MLIRALGSAWILTLFLVGIANAGLVERIAQIKPAVLPVGNFNALDNPRFGFRGTGFVVGDGNLLVTNAHVLPPAKDEGQQQTKLAVLVRGGSHADTTTGIRFATLVKLDKSKDLALLRFEGPPLPALSLADGGEVQEGLAIAFIGFPIGGALGFSAVTHHGVIASITPIALPSASSQQLNVQAIKRLRDGTFNILQLDATAYPGNSGGPVFSVDTGKVVGVINMVLIKGSKETALSHPSGISYAIPVDFVRDLLAEH